MDINACKAGVVPSEVGEAMYRLVAELYPICRSITGNGVRETLRLIGQHIPVDVHEVPTGTQAFDWSVPKEWNIKDAYIKGADGSKIADFKRSNLHILNYSIPIHRKVSLAELRQHLFTLPDHPEWVPYRTSYYSPNWGFCLSHDKLNELEDGEYEVYIDASLDDGYLSYGEYFVPGRTTEEVLLSCHICHPSLCNDNLSGIALCTFLAKCLRDCSLRYSYRFLFIPGTIGSIVWLAANESKVQQIKHGMVVACVGDSGNLTYKKTRQGSAPIDHAVEKVLADAGQPFQILDFSPYGYDERQFCSPGFNLPVGSLTRTPHGRYPEYHTSADNLRFVQPEYLGDSFVKYLSVVQVLEGNQRYLNQNPKCEPQLGRRGLYRTFGGTRESKDAELALLWVLNLSDGQHSLLDIAERAKLPFELINRSAGALREVGLLEECP
jgi:aminopeptidase-like protein